MCQPKPGPRCSGHARAAMTRVQATVDRTEATYSAAKSAWEAIRPPDAARMNFIERRDEDAALGFYDDPAYDDAYMPDPDPRTPAQAAAEKALDRATVAHQKAKERLREAQDLYDATPDGRQELTTAINAARDAGDEQAITRLQWREWNAHTLRQDQQRELAVSLAQKANLVAASPEAHQVMAAADAEASRLERLAAVHHKIVDDLYERERALRPDSGDEAWAEWNRITAQINEAMPDLRRAEDRYGDAAVYAERVRAHVAAGLGTAPADLAGLTANRQDSTIYRTVDGQTTTWAYREPTKGLPFGYYESSASLMAAA